MQADGGLRESHQIWALTLSTCPGRIQAGRKYRASAELGPRVGPAIDSQYVAETEWLMLKKQVATCTKLEPEPTNPGKPLKTNVLKSRISVQGDSRRKTPGVGCVTIDDMRPPKAST